MTQRHFGIDRIVEQLEVLSKKEKDNVEISSLFLNLGKFFDFVSNYPKAIEYKEKAFVSYKKEKGVEYCDMKLELAKSCFWNGLLFQAIQLQKASLTSGSIVELLNRKAVLCYYAFFYHRYGNFSILPCSCESKKFHFQEQGLSQTIDMLSDVIKQQVKCSSQRDLMLLISYGILASMYYNSGRREMAIVFFNKVIDGLRHHPCEHKLALAYNNLGIIYLQLSQIDEAVKNLSIANVMIKSLRPSKDTVSLDLKKAFVQYNLCFALKDAGKVDELKCILDEYQNTFNNIGRYYETINNANDIDKRNQIQQRKRLEFEIQLLMLSESLNTEKILKCFEALKNDNDINQNDVNDVIFTLANFGLFLQTIDNSKEKGLEYMFQALRQARELEKSIHEDVKLNHKKLSRIIHQNIIISLKYIKDKSELSAKIKENLNSFEDNSALNDFLLIELNIFPFIFKEKLSRSDITRKVYYKEMTLSQVPLMLPANRFDLLRESKWFIDPTLSED